MAPSNERATLCAELERQSERQHVTEEGGSRSQCRGSLRRGNDESVSDHIKRLDTVLQQPAAGWEPVNRMRAVLRAVDLDYTGKMVEMKERWENYKRQAVTTSSPAVVPAPAPPAPAPSPRRPGGPTVMDELLDIYVARGHFPTPTEYQTVFRRHGLLESDQEVCHIIATGNGGADHPDNYFIASRRYNLVTGTRLDHVNVFNVGEVRGTRAVHVSRTLGNKLGKYSGPDARELMRRGEEFFRRVARDAAAEARARAREEAFEKQKQEFLAANELFMRNLHNNA